MTTPDTNEPETFEHMLTTFGIMVVDAEGKDDENDRRQEAFDYANDWLEAERRRRETAARIDSLLDLEQWIKLHNLDTEMILDGIEHMVKSNIQFPDQPRLKHDDRIAALTTEADSAQSDTAGRQ